MMNMKLPFVLTTLSILLAGCGGGSNTIAGNDSTTTTASNLCPASNANCARIVFDDTPVANLSFECGVYFGTTGNTGELRCPVNSTVSFYVKATNGSRRVNLGAYLVKPVRTSTAAEASNAPLIRITVKDLAENITGNSITSLDQPAATTAINLSRFLQSIGLASEPYIASAPVNRIFIDKDLINGTAAKEATATSAAVAATPSLDVLTADIKPEDFSDETFATKLKPWLDAHNRVLISASEAKARLNKNYLAIKSGVYFGSPGQRLNIGQENTDQDYDLGISGIGTVNSKIQVTNAFYAVTGRDGASIGYGMQWAVTDPGKDQTDPNQAIINMYITNKFAKMRVIGGGVNPYTGRFDDFKLLVSRANYIGDQDTSYTSVTTGSTLYESTFDKGNTFTFLNGKLQRDLVIPGTATAYKKYLDTDLKDISELGTWEQRTDSSVSTGDRIYAGRATVFKIAGNNSYLDREVWRVKDLVPTGQTYIFPLYATLHFTYGDAYLTECKKQLGEVNCPTKRDQSIVIQENGDIWTSFNSTPTECVAPIPNAELPQIKDVRIGTIRAAYLSPDASQYYISPTIMMSGPDFKQLDGMQIGTSALSYRVKINVTGVRQAVAGNNGSLNVVSAETITDENGNELVKDIDNQSAATWANGYNGYISGIVAKAESDKEGSAPDALKLAATQSTGVLTIDPSPCYKVMKK